MTRFQNIIIKQFVDGESIVEIAIKYDFEGAFAPGLFLIDKYIKSGQFDELPTLVGSILVSTNEILCGISNLEHKNTLEELAKILLAGSVTALKQNEASKDILLKCSAALKQTCELKGYDFLELSSLLSLESYQVVKRVEGNELKRPFYDWCGSPEELIELSKDVQSKNIINGLVAFRALFKPIIKADFTFSANQSKIEELLVLFLVLKELKLIKPRITSGHFRPLEQFGIDNGRKLFESRPNKVLEKLKRNKARYDSIYRSMENLVKGNCAHSLGL